MTDLNFLRDMFLSIAALSAGVLIIVDWLKTLLHPNATWTKVISWVVSLGVSAIGFWAGYGLFEAFELLPSWQGWLYTAVVGASTALIANGVSTYENTAKLLAALRYVFEWVLSLFKK